jgi:LysM repeat protein
MTRETKFAIAVTTVFLALAGGLWAYVTYALPKSTAAATQVAQAPAAPSAVRGAPAATANPPAQPPSPEPPILSDGGTSAIPSLAEFLGMIVQTTQERSAEVADLLAAALEHVLSGPPNVSTATASPPQSTDSAKIETATAAAAPALTMPPPPTPPTLITDNAKPDSNTKPAPAPASVPAPIDSAGTGAPRTAVALNAPVPAASAPERPTESPPAMVRTADAAAVGGIPVTIRQQPDLPLTTPPPAAAVVPSRNTAIRPAAHVEDYEVTLYDVRPGDSYASISQGHYGSERYQAALAAFNSALNPPTATPTAGQRLRIPPAEILERRYRNLIAGLPEQRPDVSGYTAVPEAGRQPARLLPNLGPEQATTGLGSPVPRVPAGTSALAKDMAQADWARETKPYKVRPNDTIWSIAKQTLGKGERWPEISRLNREILPDVNQLRAGMTLRLPPDAKLDTAETPQ